MSLFNELKRRNVFRVGIAYAVATWLLLQLSDILAPLLGLSGSTQKLVLLLLVIGFVPALILAWAFEMTPEGIKKEKDVDRQQSITPRTGRKLDFAIIGMLAFTLVYFIWESRFSQPQSASISTESTLSARTSEPVQLDPPNAAQSIAVLPFVNMSSDPEQEYFSDGLAEELLNRLAKNDQLRVAARTSAFQFKGQNLDVADIGRQLKVAHVLEGSVRKAGNRLRITAQLIKVDTGFHLWSETYEREIDDIFAIQDDISLAISKALEAELGASPELANSQPTDNLAAYQLYLEARYLVAKRGEANMLRANELFEQAVALDPKFSSAWSGMAFNYSLLPAYGSKTSARQAWVKIKVAANKAIQFDPANAEAYVALARSTLYDDYASMRAYFEKAYALAPNNADVVNLYGDFMVQTGDFQAAERLEREAIGLDPLAAVHYSDLAFVLLPQGRYEEGLQYGRTSARLEPDSIDRVDALVIALLASGLYDESEQIMQRFAQQGTDIGYINTWYCRLYYQQGDAQKLREKLVESIQFFENNTRTGSGTFTYTLAAFYTAWLDGTDAALPLLAKAYEIQEWLLTWPEYFYLPEYVSDDPAWLAFWQQPGLAELMAIRRANKKQDHIGYWKDRPAQ